jgi:hypothetical protein
MPPSAMDVTNESEFMKVLVIGSPGVGKSVFASTFPATVENPGYVYDFSETIVTYKGKPFDYDQFQLNPQGWREFEKAHMEVMKTAKEHKYQTVIVDDLTAFESLAMEQALALDPKRSEANGPLWNVHYQLCKNLMEGKLRQILNYPANIVFICHDDIITDKVSGAVIKIQPRLPGQLPTLISGYFNEVYFATTKRENVNGVVSTRYLLQTVSIGFLRARSRLSGVEHLLPDFVDNNYNAVINHLRKGVIKK